MMCVTGKEKDTGKDKDRERRGCLAYIPVGFLHSRPGDACRVAGAYVTTSPPSLDPYFPVRSLPSSALSIFSPN